MERDEDTKDCPRCRKWQQQVMRLEKQVAQLQEQIKQLQEKLEQQERSAKRQTVRFARRRRVADPKKPGRKPGHPGTFRQTTVRPDEVIDVPVERCPDCGVPLENIQTHEQFQTELPEVKPIVTQFNVQVGTCPCCGKRVQGRHERQTSDALGAAAQSFGPNVHALAATLKYEGGVSYAKIGRVLGGFFGFAASASTFVRAAQRIAHKAQPTIEGLRQQLRRSECVHADETGWRIGTAPAWEWVFCNEQITLLEIAPSRGHEVILKMLGEDFQHVLCSDGFCAYDVPDYLKLRCNAHVLARISGLKETLSDGLDRFRLEQIEELFGESARLRARQGEMTPVGYWRRVAEIENRFDDWLLINTKFGHEDLQRLARHLNDHRQEWLLYLYNPELPTTNNLAERQLRPGVITRRMGGCNKTTAGALATRTLASLVATCRQQARSFRELVCRLLHSRSPTPIDLASLPAQ